MPVRRPHGVAVVVTARTVSVHRLSDGAPLHTIKGAFSATAVLKGFKSSPNELVFVAEQSGIGAIHDIRSGALLHTFQASSGPRVDAAHAGAAPSDLVVTAATTVYNPFTKAVNLVSGHACGRVCVWPFEGEMATWGTTVHLLPGRHELNARVTSVVSVQAPVELSGPNYHLIISAAYCEDGVLVQRSIGANESLRMAQGHHAGDVNALAALPRSRLAVLMENCLLLIYELGPLTTAPRLVAKTARKHRGALELFKGMKWKGHNRWNSTPFFEQSLNRFPCASPLSAVGHPQLLGGPRSLQPPQRSLRCDGRAGRRPVGVASRRSGQNRRGRPIRPAAGTPPA